MAERSPIGYGWSSRRTWNVNLWLSDHFARELFALTKENGERGRLAVEIRKLASSSSPPMRLRWINWYEIAESWHSRCREYGTI